MLARYRGVEVATAGDGFLATFDGPGRAVRCAESIIEALAAIDVPIRAGVHTGEIERMGDNIGGMAVHIGSRVGAHAGAGEILVSSTVKDLTVGSGISYEESGEHQLKGVREPWRLYQVHTGS
jgi:class 3 adenylate cyclase